MAAVLVGLALLPCADGMMAGEHMAQGATTAMVAGGGASMAESDVSGSHDLGGLLATCLMFLVAVVTAMVGLRQPWRRIVVRAHARASLSRATMPRALSLAELCLLRT